MKYRSLLFLSIWLLSINKMSWAQSPVPPVPLPPQEEEIFKVVEEMPRFPGCEHLNKSSKSIENCAKEEMLNFIDEYLEYPETAKINGVEGMAVIQFTVWKDSTLRNIKIVRNPGEGTGEAAAKLVESMNNLNPKWRPGFHKGSPRCVQYTLPIKFKLKDTEKPRLKRKYEYNDLIPLSKLHEEPKFPDCRKSKDNECTVKKLNEFIINNQIYPEKAIENKTEGVVEVSFVIERDGTLTNIRAINLVKDGLSEDAVEIFRWMNSEDMRWVPGMMNFEPVRSLYTVSVNYNIEAWLSRN